MAELIDHTLATRRRLITGGAKGSSENIDDEPKVSIRWNVVLFRAINRAARKNNTSFAHEVRRLVALGLKHDEPQS